MASIQSAKSYMNLMAEACVFKINIPLDFEVSKTKNSFQDEFVIHNIQKIFE